MIRGKFFLIDPKMHKTTFAETCFNLFRTYYASRGVKSIDWDNETIEHPLQIDDHNCGIFVINYIINYCETHFTNQSFRKRFIKFSTIGSSQNCRNLRDNLII
jgi:hypothetical protein